MINTTVQQRCQSFENLKVATNFTDNLLVTEERIDVEHNKWVNTTQEGLEFVMSHPEYLEEYRNFLSNEIEQVPTEASQVNKTLPFFHITSSFTERKKFSEFFTSLIFVYKSVSLKRFRIEQLCPSIDSMISLVFVH